MEQDRPQLNEDNVKGSLEKLERLDIKSASLKEIDALLYHLFRGQQMNVPKFNPGVNIIRARVVENKPLYYKDITYPPKEHVKNFGRANTINQSMFYGSNARNAPFFEIGATVGDLVVISHWRTKSNLIVTHAGFTEENVKTLESSRQLHEIYDFVAETKKLSPLNYQVYDFIGKAFSQKIKKDEEYLYKLTFSIANKLLASPLINGILYPTIAMNGNVDNLVLKPEYVDLNLELLYMELKQITNIEGLKYAVKEIDNAVEINANGEIVWTGRQLGWILPSKQALSIHREGEVDHANDDNGNRLIPVPTNLIVINPTPKYKSFLSSFENTMRHTVDISLKNSFEEITVKCTINLDFNKKVKFITMYIPTCQNPEAVADIILSKRNEYLKVTDNVEISMKDTIEHSVIKDVELIFNNEVYIYSDTPILKEKLDPYESYGLIVQIVN